MDNQELRTLLEQLRNELDQTESIDEKGRELLNGLDSDIHSLLERSEVVAHPPLNSLQRLEESIEYFEATHPTLSATLVKLMTVLGNAGI
jgi:hypothetical protein